MSSALLKQFLPSQKLSGTVIALFSNRMIQRSAAALFGVFVPIFLVEQLGSIQAMLFFYWVGFLLYALLAPAGAIIASKWGFEKAMRLSVIGGTVFYGSLYFFDWNIWLLAVIAIIAITWDRMFLWIPFHSGFAKFSDNGSRGRTLAVYNSVFSFFAAGLPFLSGYLITEHGFGIIILTVVILYACSAIPFFYVQRINESYSFSYRQSWRILFHSRNRRMMLSFMALGIEDFAWLIIWPIFVWQILDGSYSAVGLITSVILLATIVMGLLVGKFSDSMDNNKLLLTGTVLDALGWLGKIFVGTGFQIFAISTYHNLTKIAARYPFDTIMYGRASDAGHYVDEFTVMREMSVHLSRVILIPIIMLLLQFTSISVTFIFAAGAALLLNFIRTNEDIDQHLG